MARTQRWQTERNSLEVRVLFVVPNLSGGGAQFVTSQWSRYLAQVGDSVTVYTTHPNQQDRAPEHVSLVTPPKGGFAAQTRDLANYLKANPVDIVVALLPYWNLMSIAAVRSLRKRRPKVAISGRNMANGLRTVYGGSYARKQWLARRIYRYADLFIAISHPVGAEAIGEYSLPADRVTVVPNPALAKLEGQEPSTVVSTRIPGTLDLVVPARLVPQKRPLIAVDVASTLTSQFPGGVTLHYFGVGPLQDAIVSHAQDAGVNTILHGWVEHWFEQCPAQSVVLLASLAEGFGNVLIEAAAAGFKSVVSSRCLGSADAIVPGITGELAAGDSVADYAAAVLAASSEGVRHAAPWLQRFSFEGSGLILREQLIRTLSGNSCTQEWSGN